MIAFASPDLDGQVPPRPGDRPPPAAVQVELLRKILAFDRDLTVRGPSAIVLGVVFTPHDDLSRAVKDEIVKAAPEASISVEGLPLRIVPLPFVNPARLREDLSLFGVNILYLAPFPAREAPDVLRACEERRIPTVTADPEWILRGAAVGFRWTGAKPEIVVDVGRSQAQGFRFSSKLLRLARVRKG